MLKLEKKRVHEQLFKECQSCIYGAFTSVCNIHKHAPSPPLSHHPLIQAKKRRKESKKEKVKGDRITM